MSCIRSIGIRVGLGSRWVMIGFRVEDKRRRDGLELGSGRVSQRWRRRKWDGLELGFESKTRVLSGWVSSRWGRRGNGIGLGWVEHKGAPIPILLLIQLIFPTGTYPKSHIERTISIASIKSSSVSTKFEWLTTITMIIQLRMGFHHEQEVVTVFSFSFWLFSCIVLIMVPYFLFDKSVHVCDYTTYFVILFP